MYEHTLKLESEYRQYISGEDLNALVVLPILNKFFLTFSCDPRCQHHSHEHSNQNSCRRGAEENPLDSEKLLVVLLKTTESEHPCLPEATFL